MKFIHLFILIVLVSGCETKPLVIDHQGNYTGTGSNAVYIVSHGWHTGIVIPSGFVFQSMDSLKERFHSYSYIEFGWGDNGFYQANEITTGLTLQAIFIPTESVVHAVGVPEDIYEYFDSSKIEELSLTNSEIASLIKFIDGSFAKNTDGDVISIKHGIYGDSQFYQGVGKYHLFNTCNKWTAKGLKSFGMDIEPMLNLTADGIMSFLDEQD